MPNLPLPKGIPKMPKDHVYLGMGETFKKKGSFIGCAIRVGKAHKWDMPYMHRLHGDAPSLHYCAPKDSEIAKLNRTNKQ